jgi:MscS family membrane protein
LIFATGKPPVARKCPVLKSARRLRFLNHVFLLLSLTLSIAGQTLNFGSKPASSARDSSPAPIADPLGRSTPRGTITAFVRSVHRNDYVSAARYMQIATKQKTNVEVLARDLKELMDRYFSQSITTISDLPTGELNDGLPLDQERVGPLTMGGGNVYILLVRVTDPQAGQIWLISTETLAQVPAWYSVMEKTWIERVMPQLLLDYNLFGVPLAQWVAWLASIGVPLLLFWFLAWICISALKGIVGDSPRREFIYASYARIRWPSILFLTLCAHLLSLGYLGFTLSFRIVYTRVGLVILVIVLAWLVQRSSTMVFERARSLLERKGQSGTESLILLGERMFKVLIALAAIFLILTIIGVDTKTALAGVGIGGVAVALGAQKTVENLLGGIFLLTDKALAIGDMCCISNRQGWIEDITLRSIRLRTLEQTLLSIPAGILSQANIENFATRRKILAQTNLLLRCGTTVEQLRTVLEGIHKLLADNSKVETETARIRLTNFGMRAIELELYAYILTPDYMEFLALREELLLQIAAIVESSGSSFAQPTEFVYLEQRLEPEERIRNVPISSPKRPDVKTDLKAIKERTG